MATLHVIEERKAGSWTFYRLAKDADDAAKGVAAMRLANPEWEVRAAEYARRSPGERHDVHTRWADGHSETSSYRTLEQAQFVLTLNDPGVVSHTITSFFEVG